MADPDAPVPPKKRRAIFKNVPAWAAQEDSPPASSVSPRAAKQSRADKHDVGAQDHENSGLKRGDFFSRADETLRHYAGPAILATAPQKDGSKSKQKPKAKAAVQSDADDDTENDVSLKYSQQTTPPPRTGHLSRGALLSANGSAPPREESEDIYGHPHDSHEEPRLGVTADEPIALLSDEEDPVAKPVSQTAHSISSDSDAGVLPSVELAQPSSHVTADDHAPSTDLNPVPQKPKTPPPPPKAPSPEKPDPVLAILITSRLPNTNPIIVRRKYRQRLREVREAWCKKNGLSETTANTVFLTWRARRLYDFTTCKSLGIQVNDLGEILIDGKCQPPGAEGSQIEMEAVTQEIQNEIQKEKEERARAKEKETSAFLDGDNKGPSQSQKKRENQAKLILRAKEQEDYKVLVNMSTKFEKVIETYRQRRDIPETSSITLMFEGDKLEPSLEVKESDVSHNDIIDVYVK